MNQNGNNIEARLWDAADELWANSKLKSSEYSVPVLGLIFLRYADHKSQAATKELAGKASGWRRLGHAGNRAQMPAGLAFRLNLSREAMRFTSLELKDGLMRGQMRNTGLGIFRRQSHE